MVSATFGSDQLRTYVIGLVEIRSDEFGYRLPNVDEVMAPGDSDFSAPDGPERIAHYAIVGCEGKDAQSLLELLQSHVPCPGSRTRDHAPRRTFSHRPVVA
jgi:hypothetical protein